MRWPYIAIALAACADSPPSTSDEPVLDLDVVLHRDRIEVYTNTTDIPCECKETDASLPPVGSCLYLDDIIDNCSCGMSGQSSCVEEMRVVAGDQTKILGRLPYKQWRGDITGFVEPTLFISGCSANPIVIPLAWSPVETPALSTRYFMHEFEASWSTVEELALIQGGWWGVADRCMTSQMSQKLPTPIFVPDFLWAKLSVLRPAQVMSTEGAVVRVWSASDSVYRSFGPCRDDDTLCWLGTDDSSVH